MPVLFKYVRNRFFRLG